MININKIVVVGSGNMGAGIAQVAAQAGYDVMLTDIEERQLNLGLDAIRTSLDKIAKKGKITQSEQEQILKRISVSLDIKSIINNADLIIEAIPEELELKKTLFKKIDQESPPKTILASNTSSISITAIASATNRSDKVVGMHFAYPVPLMMGVEIIRGRDTSEETIEAVKQVCQKMGKDTFIALDFPGFAGNRLLPLFLNEAFYVVWQGISTPEDLDKSCKVMLHHPMGPLELADYSGLDTLLNVLEYLYKEMGEKYRPCPLLKQLVAAGHLGRKTGRGVYRYDSPENK